MNLSYIENRETYSSFVKQIALTVAGVTLAGWMRGFVHVADTPYFAKSGKGRNALLDNLAAGKYKVKA